MKYLVNIEIYLYLIVYQSINIYLLTGVVFDVSLQIETALGGFDVSSESGF